MASMVSSRADFNRLHHMLHMVQISFLLTDLEAAIQFKVPREKMKEAALTHPSPSTLKRGYSSKSAAVASS